MHPESGKGAGHTLPLHPQTPAPSGCHTPVAKRSLLRRAATAEIQYGCCRPWVSCMPCACRASASGFFFVSPHRATDLPGRGEGTVRAPCAHPTHRPSPVLTRHRRLTPCAPR